MTLVVGAGRSGWAACQLLLEQGDAVWLYDDRPREMPVGVSPWSSLEDLPPVRRLIVSPGVSPQHPLRRLAGERGLPQQGELHFGLSFCSVPWVCGITGTNGKTTVTELTSWILQQSNCKALAAGNIGLPLSELVSQIEKKVQNPSRLVLELSSYQLEDLEGPWLDAAAWLNLTPDHLDRYGSMQAYAAAKARMAGCLKPHAPLFVHHEVLAQWGERLACSKQQLVSYGAPHADLSWRGEELWLRGSCVARWSEVLPQEPMAIGHDLDNLTAAVWLAVQAGLTWSGAWAATRGFQKGPHRCELIASIRGVQWVNDSKGTNLDAVLKASAAFSGPQILIAGGVHKGHPYTLWAEQLKTRVRQILAIGEAAEQIESDLACDIPVVRCTTLQEAVSWAHAHARPGETVLLSPGCASFDQFRDYAHRGEAFRTSVLQLARGSDTVETVGS
jgi:UDP-N-acetylmuramoylalanine--D-glutamate ligase